MPEADATLKQKTDELEAVVDEVRRELTRIDEAQRRDAHRELVAICKDASAWLEQCARQADSASPEEAAAMTQKAEIFLGDLRMRRSAI